MDLIRSMHPLARAWLLDGPLSSYVEAFQALLERGRYAEGSSAAALRAWSHFARWIALWLGHESPATTHQYVDADLAMKEKALARLQDSNVVPRRFRADDDLLKFLKTL